MGDFNLDLLKIEDNQHIKEFTNMMFSSAFYPLTINVHVLVARFSTKLKPKIKGAETSVVEVLKDLINIHETS